LFLPQKLLRVPDLPVLRVGLAFGFALAVPSGCRHFRTRAFRQSCSVGAPSASARRGRAGSWTRVGFFRAICFTDHTLCLRGSRVVTTRVSISTRQTPHLNTALYDDNKPRPAKGRTGVRRQPADRPSP